VKLLLGNGGFMAFGMLYTLTATDTALPAAHANGRADDAYMTAAYGADGPMPPPPPPKNTRKQNTAL